jgi:uncharacterized membrane protein
MQHLDLILIASPVTHKLHGNQQHGTMMDNIFRFTAESIKVSGILAQNVIQYHQIMLYFLVLIVTSIIELPWIMNIRVLAGMCMQVMSVFYVIREEQKRDHLIMQHQYFL